jgi:hypothetical protein
MLTGPQWTDHHAQQSDMDEASGAGGPQVSTASHGFGSGGRALIHARLKT